MKGDFSRFTFDKRKHYSSVRMQQGRVQLDADWNEQVDIAQHLRRVQADDLIGPSATFSTGGFEVIVENSSEETTEDSGPRFRIGEGRYYVDGIVCENDATIPFNMQPDLPRDATAKESENRYLVYLDVWQRDISALEDPDILEPALGGADTTTRTKTIWQVKLLPLDDDTTHTDALEKLIRAAADRPSLSAGRKASSTELENHLYRVEIHDVEQRDNETIVTYKWSRENATVAWRIAATDVGLDELDVTVIENDDGQPQQLNVCLEGLDGETAELKKDDWVEIVDDCSSLTGVSRPLLKVAEDPAPGSTMVLLNPEQGGPKLDVLRQEKMNELKRGILRRWDHGSAADGWGQAKQREALRVTRGEQLKLEHGIYVQFHNGGQFNVGDYWLIPTRSYLGSVQWPQSEETEPKPLPLPPTGIDHHYAPLAILLRGEGDGWEAEEDLRSTGESLTESTKKIASLEEKADHVIEELARAFTYIGELRNRVDDLLRRIRTLEEPHGSHYFSSDTLEKGDVVSLVASLPEGSELSQDSLFLERTTGQTAALLVGVVKECDSDGEEYRVAQHGLTLCKVIGDVEVGDLLVPSDEPGYACSAGFYIRPGTLIGKSLQAHSGNAPDSKGVIAALVGLG